MSENQNDNTKQLEEFFKEKLQEQYNRGLRIGVLTVSKIVLDKLSNSSKPFMTRIAEVKKFCAAPWGKRKIDENEKETEEIKEQLAEEVENSAEVSVNSDDSSKK